MLSDRNITDKIKWIESELGQLKKTNHAISFSDQSCVLFVNTSEIILCESIGNYTKIHLADGSFFTITKTLKIVEDSIQDSSFIRISNSHLINLIFLKKYIKQDCVVVLKNMTEVSVSKSRKEAFLQKFLRV